MLGFLSPANDLCTIATEAKMKHLSCSSLIQLTSPIFVPSEQWSPSICLPIYLPICLPIWLPICLPICLAICHTFSILHYLVGENPPWEFPGRPLCFEVVFTHFWNTQWPQILNFVSCSTTKRAHLPSKACPSLFFMTASRRQTINHLIRCHVFNKAVSVF